MPDWKIALRMLRKTPGLTLVAVACLGVGIGLTTAAFHVIYGAFLTPLPVEGGERLVMVREYHRAGRYNISTTPEQFRRWQEHAQSFEALGAWQVKNVPLQAENAATTIVRAAYVTSNALAMAGATPQLGRSLSAQDAAPGAAPVIVLSDSLWRSRFAADPGILGRIVRVGGQAHTVIGVMPERFAFPVREYAWLPLPEDPSAALPAGQSVQVFAKLKPRVSIATGQAELATLRDLHTLDAATRTQTEVLLRPFTRGYMAPEEEWAVYGVLLGLGLFLLVTAGNLANLLLARNAARMREIAMRFALGASRPRLIVQLLMEAALLGGTSAAFGLLLARACLTYVEARVNDLPWWFNSELGATTVGFAVASALAASALAGIAPALKLTRVSVHDALKESQPGFARVRFGRLSSSMLVAQMAIAISFVSALGLLASGLFGFSYEKYNLPAREVLVAQVYFGQPEKLTPQMPVEERRAIWRRFLEECKVQQREIAARLAASPSVREVSYASLLPGNDVEAARIELEPSATRGAAAQATTRIAETGAGFFPVLGAPIVHGRDFLPSEHDGEPSSVIVNEPFARKHFGGSALGRHLRLLPGGAATVPGLWLEVVGVVPDLALNPGDPANADGIYLPLSRTNVVRLAIRTSGEPGLLTPAIHETITLVAPRAQVQWSHTLETQMAEVVTIFRSLGGLLLVIGGTALLLTAVSLFSLVSFAVTQRTREIGIRMALGATRGAVLRGAFRREGLQLLLGSALGATLATALARLVLLMPFPLRTAEPLSLAACIVLLAAVGALACATPLRRALAIQPTEALRHE